MSPFIVAILTYVKKIGVVLVGRSSVNKVEEVAQRVSTENNRQGVENLQLDHVAHEI